MGGELAASTFSDYKSAASLLVRKFGGQRLVESLEPSDFESLRTAMAKTWGVHRRGKFVQLIRTTFKYGSENGLIVKNVLFGSTFKRPGKKTMRMHKVMSGKKMFAVEEIRLMLDALEGREVTVTKAGKPIKIKLAVNPQLRAMILLAVNGGLGNTDIGDLQFSNIKIDDGWVTYPRPKTGPSTSIPIVEGDGRRLEGPYSQAS